MDFAVSNRPLDKIKADALVIGLGKKSDLPEVLPDATRKQISAFIKAGDFNGSKGQHAWLHGPEDMAAARILLVGTGDNTPSDSQWQTQLRSTVKALQNAPIKHAVCLLDSTLAQTLEWQVREGSRIVEEGLYRFDQYRSQPAAASKLAKWTYWHAEKDASLGKAHKTGKGVAAGVNLARDLGNLPPNDCYPEYLSGVARELAKQYEKLTVKVVSQAQAEKMGMGAFVAVAKGSERQGQIIVMEYKGSKPTKQGPVALVGKGITFDTGGISLKPGANMDEMKYDMGGAASVFGSVKTVCELDLPIHLVAVVAAAENMPDGRASRPGDIVKTLSGQTVEILNTDAEGRLVLCDALTYVQQKHKPHTVIDIATLTGACVVALGSHAQAVYANDDDLSQTLLAAGQATGDRGWPMPLWDEYQSQLDSPFADMQNIGGPKGGSITAACFLSRFAKDVKWAHLDIAGTAWISGGMSKGATGRPVPMLTRFLMDLAK
ncbi:leucyl aminopeptidase [Alcanivorax sp. MD8A]|uniref:leucyl aminopeptidase n=1 Tax=Alcanivorax sp. MD8A TaxID=1177157 RepID=UPI000C9C6D6E|nr:leucyl aminopeptidase [Alcanivorax sp. MD8A]PNE03179.1 leucyl aminopeptidase [Alcanivorax sp. MD8A]